MAGVSPGDYTTHKTLFAGPDPADTNRVLVRKLVQTSDLVWAYEETRISAAANEGQSPSVHTTLHRLGQFNINEDLSEEELKLRLQYRAVPNVIGFSLFTRGYANGGSSSWSIVENSLTKSGGRWTEWLRDMQDRRDLSNYLYMRWMLH